MKTELVRVRLTEQEKMLLQKRASDRNMSMSDYIKYCCLISPPNDFGYEREEAYGSNAPIVK